MAAERLQYQNVALRRISDSWMDRNYVPSLFRFQDIKQHFLFKGQHVSDADSFFEALVAENKNGHGFHCVIEDNLLNPVGLVTVQAIREPGNDEVLSSADLAIHPNDRNRGYARNAIEALLEYLANYSINTIVFDISSMNKAATTVALKCGFTQSKSATGGVSGYYDRTYPEIGLRTKWTRKVHGSDPRAETFREANEAFQSKNYQEAIRLYQAASQMPYRDGSPFTDAMAMSNIGMAYSSMREYRKAYTCLKKAWDMGCRNASVSKELEWLRWNAPDAIS